MLRLAERLFDGGDLDKLLTKASIWIIILAAAYMLGQIVRFLTM